MKSNTLNNLYKSSNEIFNSIIINPDYNQICRKDIYTFPRPYYKNIKDVKAIVLGADPSNPQNKTFEFVFGLERQDKSPYFFSILNNLRFLRLNLDNTYVENLCKNYFTKVTDENDLYIHIADKFWLPQLKIELDNFFSNTIHVLVTSWKVLEVIVPQSIRYKKRAKDIYR